MRGKDAAKKKSKRDKNVDMEKLADGLQKLGEDDLLHVVTMVHDNKTSDTYTKNDVESEFSWGKRRGRDIFECMANETTDGEFHVDLYTLPDSLVKMLWEFTAEKIPL